jgi:hypothetical protein
MWTDRLKVSAISILLMVCCMALGVVSREPVVDMDKNYAIEEEHSVWEEVLEEDMDDERDQRIMDIHSPFLQPEEMKDLHRLLRWGKWGNGGGGGGGGGGGMGGGLTDAEHKTIQNMLAYRGNMKRTVTPIQNNNGKVIGAVSTTTSDDPTTARTIQEHVLGMQALVESGRVARQWDPLYKELFQHIPEYNIQIETLPKEGNSSDGNGKHGLCHCTRARSFIDRDQIHPKWTIRSSSQSSGTCRLSVKEVLKLESIRRWRKIKVKTKPISPIMHHHSFTPS